MCGIFATVCLGPGSSDDQHKLHKNHEIMLRHRGPDDSNDHMLKNRLGLISHYRLRITDLTEKSSQPMISRDGNVVLAFNGEIYNYVALRKELEKLGRAFRTDGDTEVILNAYQEWGTDCIKKFSGMFAFLIIDYKINEILLVRDRFGEKPLYYFVSDNLFRCSSEIGPLIATRGEAAKLSKSAVADFLAYGYVNSESTLITGIKKVPPASFIKINMKTARYKCCEWACSDGTSLESPTTAAFDQVFGRSVKQCMTTDVKTAVLLSGGLDSSLVAMKAAQYSSKLNTYNVVFTGADYSTKDQHNANIISAHIGSNHNTLEISHITADDIIEAVSSTDEAIADPSLIPTFLIFKEISKDCKVALGGDGADELFGGYRKYINHGRLQILNRLSPNLIKNFLRIRLENKISGGRLNRILQQALAQNFQTLSGVPTLFSTSEINEMLSYKSQSNTRFSRSDSSELLRVMMDFDINNYLPNNILHKVDRAAMASSVEARSPFLNEEVFAFSKTLPRNELVSGGVGKVFLRRYSENIFPKNYMEVKKNGFAPEFKGWFQKGSAIRAFVEETLFDNSAVFSRDTIENIFATHDSMNDQARKLTALLFLELFSKKYSLELA